MLSTRLMFNLRCLASQFVNINGFTHTALRGVSTKEASSGGAAVFSFDDEDDDERKAEEAIEQKRNKSKLQPSHYNRQHGRPPFEEPLYDFQESLRSRRRIYGKYGEASKVNPSILWPDKKELAAMREYEEAAQPFTVQQLIQKNREKKAKEEERVRKYEDNILKKVSRVNDEIIAFHKRIAAEKKRALEITQRKNKLIEQVRKHFGYRLEPTDQKFRDMLEKLQKEERKKAKQEKKMKGEKRPDSQGEKTEAEGKIEADKELKES